MRTSLIILLAALAPLAQSHPGRTDSSGGHVDKKTGKYHHHGGGGGNRSSSSYSSSYSRSAYATPMPQRRSIATPIPDQLYIPTPYPPQYYTPRMTATPMPTVALAPSTTATPIATPPPTPVPTPAEPVWITPNGMTYHAKTCRFAELGNPVPLQAATDKGLRPCTTCH